MRQFAASSVDEESGNIGNESGCVQHLFGMSRDGKTLAEYCENRGAALENAVRHWNPDELLGTPDQEITDYLIATYSVSCPVLRHDEGTSTEAEPVDLPAYSPIPGIAFGGHDRLPTQFRGLRGSSSSPTTATWRSSTAGRTRSTPPSEPTRVLCTPRYLCAWPGWGSACC